MIKRKCANCNATINKNHYLCKKCYNELNINDYRRLLAYDKENNETLIYDYIVTDSSHNNIYEHIKEKNLTIIKDDRLPHFLEGNLEILTLNKFNKSNFILIKKSKGFPNFYPISKNNIYQGIYIKIDNDFYFTEMASTWLLNILENDYFKELAQETNLYIEKTKNSSNKLCLLCDDNTISEEHFLCPSCYHLYKNKKLFLEMSVNDSNIKLLDATYEGRLECDDGHIVKSQAERDIDNYLFEKNIKHGYETILPIYDNGKRIELRPDFCIFDGDEKIYIEYWGIEDDPDYEKRKEFKMPLYKKAGITLINMYKKTDIRNIRAALEDKLKHYKKGQINFEE